MNISFEIEKIFEDKYSIIFKTERLLKLTNSEEKIKIYTIDSKNGNILTVKEFLKEDKINDLRKLIKEKLVSAYSDSFFVEQFEDVTKDEKLYNYVAITNSKLIVQFSEYEVASGNAGPVKVEFNLEDVNNIVKEEVLNKLKVALPKVEEKEEIVEKEQPKVTGKKVALTFDDGPHSKNTKEILDLLDKYDAKATFFMLGTQVQFYENIVKEIYNRGHQLGNHSWNHKDLKKLSESEIREQIQKTDQAIKKVVGVSPKIYRPPYGSHTKQIDNIVGKPAVLWTIDTLDWKNKSPQKILEIVKKEVKNNSIILLHDIHTPTIEGTRLVLDYLKKEGYQFVRVDQLD